MNAQVDWVQALDVLLDRRAVRVADVLDGTIALLKGAIETPIEKLGEIARESGARITEIEGEKWLVKNNKQRERVVGDLRAMRWFMSVVVGSDSSWGLKQLRNRAYVDRMDWKSICRAARELGWYVVEDDFVAFVGFEMDYDQRIRVCRNMADSWSSGIDIDSDLMWQVVSSRELFGITERDYDICVALTKSGFAPK